MAAALSRALKLPGKKGPDLGEYDPLTQADSEDESEEDDLVLNYPRNGLGRDSRPGSGSAKLLGGRAGRRAGARGEAPEDEPLGATGVAVHGTDPEEKRRRARRAIRSAFFLVPLVCAALIVLLSAFLIPCRNANLQRRLQWERALGAAGGITSAPLALWDVNGDSLEDVIVGVTESPNGTHAPGSKGPVCSVVALSAVGGQRRVSKVTAAPVMYIQGGPRHPGQEAPAVVLISRSTMTAVDGSTGKTVWSAPLRDIESQALLLPDLDGDSVPDLLVATLPADKASDLSLSLVSGLTGMKLGRPLSFNVTAQGKLIGPLLHQTQKEAFYVLFGLGNIEAISLWDVYLAATGQMPVNQSLQRKDPVLEGLRRSNSSFIHLNSSSHLSLDLVSRLNSSRSDWVLVDATNALSALRPEDMFKRWTFSAGPIHSQPAPGHFNDDGVPDLFIQSSANGIMQAQVVDGASGRRLWAAEFVCPRVRLEASAVSTSAGQSAFLFWASEPIRAQESITKATAAAEPLIRRLFLLYPAYPTVLLELLNTTDTAVSSAVSYRDRQKDATYVVVSLRPTPESQPGAWTVSSTSLRAAVAKGSAVRLQQS
uniref:Family with sequence similarity 234 member B n=1 Tax=Tetraodon nigroviridis TaxID=99883 RepID=H3CZT4_TETNG